MVEEIIVKGKGVLIFIISIIIILIVVFSFLGGTSEELKSAANNASNSDLPLSSTFSPNGIIITIMIFAILVILLGMFLINPKTVERISPRPPKLF